jgi:hypothetical protein
MIDLTAAMQRAKAAYDPTAKRLGWGLMSRDRREKIEVVSGSHQAKRLNQQPWLVYPSRVYEPNLGFLRTCEGRLSDDERRHSSRSRRVTRL